MIIQFRIQELVLEKQIEFNPIKTGGRDVFHQVRGFFANNFGTNTCTQSKLYDFSKINSKYGKSYKFSKLALRVT